jgi:hypothetical protein
MMILAAKVRRSWVYLGRAAFRACAVYRAVVKSPAFVLIATVAVNFQTHFFGSLFSENFADFKCPMLVLLVIAGPRKLSSRHSRSRRAASSLLMPLFLRAMTGPPYL